MLTQEGKTNWLFVLAAVILALMVGTGLLLYINNTVKQTDRFPEVKKEQAINETSGWQTYRDEKYGFEVKYPRQYKIDGNLIKLSDTKSLRIDTDACCFPIPYPEKLERLTINGVVFEKISGSVTQNGNSTGIISYRTSQNKQGSEMQIVLIDDLGAVAAGPGKGMEPTEAFDILKDPEAKILDQMLSTFKLIEQ